MTGISRRILLGRVGLTLLPIALLLASVPAHADLIVSVQSVAVNAATSGDSLEVTLTNTGPAMPTIGGFSFEIVASSSDVMFTGGSTATTTAPYIFAGNSFDDLNSFPLVISSPGSTLDASDLANDSTMSPTIGTGVTVGLGHILFNVSNSAPTETVSVSLTPDPSTTLSDPNTNAITIDALDGGDISITGSATVPEPASLLLLASGLVFVVRREAKKSVE